MTEQEQIDQAWAELDRLIIHLPTESQARIIQLVKKIENLSWRQAIDEAQNGRGH